METTEKILFDMLKQIQEHCKNTNTCEKCIFHIVYPDHISCKISHAPQYWRLDEK